MARIFISHSTLNGELVEWFLDFLQLGMGIEKGEIFCTSYPNELPTGENFIQKIKDQIENCEAAIFLITKEYLESKFCLAELGAAWGLSKKIYPLLLVDIKEIERTPLKGIQVIDLNKENSINALYDEFCSNGIIHKPCTTEYIKRLSVFMKQIQRISFGEYILKIDTDGYYCTEISDVRNVPSIYKCYKIKGHIEEWESENSAKTDWIFFKTGVFGELKIGDKIRFKISKTEVKTWKDIGIARNIYPLELIKEKE